MLDERDEGLFAWYTVNFLMGKLHNISESFAALDLGGGSTQVTFSTNNVHTLVIKLNFLYNNLLESHHINRHFFYAYCR